jgi:5-methylcytosine-specific restriction endonuclease McrA
MQGDRTTVPPERPICRQCNERPCDRAYGLPHHQWWRPRCRKCRHPNQPSGKISRDKARGRLLDLLGRICERCGFVPEDTCQLDIDHRNGNPFDRSRENLQVLCANCHRLKTKQNGDGLTPGRPNRQRRGLYDLPS